MHDVERIRDPLHNLIEFKQASELERVLWETCQTRAFQRLRRIKQLGFSEVVYPGACHSRLMHSLGVFHTARRLMEIVEDRLGSKKFAPTKANQALAAALVHDLGHGPFSHAFEAVGKRMSLTLARHETVSDALIRNGEVSEVLKKLGKGFADDVADIVAEDGQKDIYSAVVSSQFDADRLDYMQRDRLMTGAQSGAIDFEWLLANLQIGNVPIGVDEQQSGYLETFVLGPKANMAAEAFVLGLFHLYPSVYFHKTTRACEKLFVELLCRALSLIQDGSADRTGLPPNHPITRFADNPESIERMLDLDDGVMWGSLSLMAESNDKLMQNFSVRLLGRKLYKCVDVRNIAISKIGDKDIDSFVKKARPEIEEWSRRKSNDGVPRILIDEVARSPYRPVSESKGPADRINILTPDGRLDDLRERSKVVEALQPFKIFRVYTSPEDEEAKSAVEDIIAGER